MSHTGTASSPGRDHREPGRDEGPLEGSVVVVGAGPAGSAAAALLARAGHATVLVDRQAFPRAKACGECLNPGAVAALRRLGLLESVLDRDPAVVDGWRIRWPEEAPQGSAMGTASAAGLRGRLPEPRGLALPRRELDHALLEAARAAGARVVEGVSVEGAEAGALPGEGGLDRGRAGERDPDGARPELRGRDREGRRIVARPAYVVGADGLRSRLAAALGLAGRGSAPSKASLTFRLESRPAEAGAAMGQLYLAHGATLGLAPVNPAGTRWNATLVVKGRRAGRRLARQREGMLRDWLAHAPLPWDGPARVVDGPWGSGPFHRPVSRAGRGRVVLAGDAAGYYDPLTGQGIYRALRSAELAATAVDRALQRPEEAAEAIDGYRRRLRRAVTPGRRVQRGIESVLSRSRLRRALLEGLARRGGRVEPLVAVTGDARPVRTLLHPASLLVMAGWTDPAP